ncbi:MAG: sialate O-acetylesterase [Planctomycetaceae bacterium]
MKQHLSTAAPIRVRNWAVGLRLCASVVIAVSAISCVSHAEDTPKKQLDVFIVAGQSNSVGFDANPAELTPDEQDSKTLFWFRCGDPPPDEYDVRSNGWTHLRTQPRGNPDTRGVQQRQYGNFHFPEGGFGPEFGFIRTLRKSTPDANLAVIKSSFSGTSLIDDWDPTSQDEHGACYRALIEEVSTAVEQAEKQGYSCHIRAMIWVQGESDAKADITEKYQAAILEMLASMRKELNAPELVALLGVNTRFLAVDGITPGMQAVIAAQEGAAEQSEHCVYVDLDGASLANKVHFDAAGTLEIGRRYAVAWQEWLKQTQPK